MRKKFSSLKPNQAICPNCGKVGTHSFIVHREWKAPLCKSCYWKTKNPETYQESLLPKNYNPLDPEIFKEEPKARTTKKRKHDFGGKWGYVNEELAKKVFKQNL